MSVPSSPSTATTSSRRPVCILTGISFQSGIDYYKNINEKFMALSVKNPEHPMPPNPLISLVSVDCAEYASYLCSEEWGKVRDYLWDQGLQHLVSNRFNRPFYVLASNTAHILLDAEYGGKVIPEEKIAELRPQCLHIADATAIAILNWNSRPESPNAAKLAEAGEGLTIGLLGTEPTMRQDYLKKQLLKHKGISKILVPETDADLRQIFQYIMHELGMPSEYGPNGKPIFKPETKQFFVDQARRLYERGCTGGVICGCTEIELVLEQCDFEKGEMPNDTNIRLYPSAELHIEGAAEVAAGVRTLEEFLP